MDGLLGRLYDRMGPRYWLLLVVAALGLAFFFTTAFVAMGLVGYLGAPASAFVRAIGLSDLGVEIGTCVAMILIFRRSRPALAWIKGDRSNENVDAAWVCAANMPKLHTTIAPLPITAGAAIAVFAIYRSARPSLYALAALTVGGLVVVALGLSVHMVTTGAIMRPILADIDGRFPQHATDADNSRTSLRPRIVISSLLVVVSSSWLTGGFVSHASSASVLLTLGIFSGIVVGVIFGLVLTTALTQSIFDPLQQLTRATRDVQQGDLTTRLPVIANDELGTLARSFNEMVGGLAEREALRSALGTYVDPAVAERLVAEGQILQGEEADVTIMFVDIVGFSARAERMPADVICSELNEFFALVIPLVADHGGHTNKLIGDGLMAVFGTPVKLDDHADRALRASFDIQEQMDERFRGTLRAGIGLNSGTVVVGTMGGGSKLDFTVIGDAVNVASRVEALTRQTDDHILVTDATKRALRDPVALANRGPAVIRGRAEPVSIYAAVSRIPA